MSCLICLIVGMLIGVLLAFAVGFLALAYWAFWAVDKGSK